MRRTAAFETGVDRYERWFADHESAFRAELAALLAAMPAPGFALEVGVGTGRFAVPLGVAVGLDPTFQMLTQARARGILSVRGQGETLPFRAGIFDHVLLVTTICFVDDPRALLAEIRRVLRPGGAVVIGFIDRASALGRQYQAHQAESAFYREARFFSAAELAAVLAEAGFGASKWRQTLAGLLDAVTDAEPVMSGSGAGAFVVVRATPLPQPPPRNPVATT